MTISNKIISWVFLIIVIWFGDTVTVSHLTKCNLSLQVCATYSMLHQSCIKSSGKSFQLYWNYIFQWASSKNHFLCVSLLKLLIDSDKNCEKSKIVISSILKQSRPRWLVLAGQHFWIRNDYGRKKNWITCILLAFICSSILSSLNFFCLISTFQKIQTHRYNCILQTCFIASHSPSLVIPDSTYVPSFFATLSPFPRSFCLL